MLIDLAKTSISSNKCLADCQTFPQHPNRPLMESILPAMLRIGVMLDGTRVPHWMYSVLLKIATAENLDLSLVILNGARNQKSTLWQRLRHLRQHGFAAYALIDGWCFSGKVALNAFAPRDASELLEGVPMLQATPLQEKFVDRFSEDDLNAIRSAKLDVILRFGFRIIKGDVLNAARYGVWSFHHGDNDFYRGGPALFWEISETNPVSGTILQILNEDLDGGRVIYKSFASTHRYSLFMNRNAAYWKTAAFLGRKLRDLAEAGIPALAPLTSAPEAHPKLYRTPTLPRLALFGIRSAARMAATSLHYRFWDERWFVAIAKRTTVASGAGNIPGHEPFKIISNPRNGYYADPCAISVGAQDFVFLEEYSYRSKKGAISCATVDSSGHVVDLKTVLEEPFHLSYPFVFELDGEYFMIPESSEANSVRLYRATAFPTCWRFEAALLPLVKAVDATIHRQDGMLWLFTNIAEAGASKHDELHLFYAPSLKGPWKPHRQNPIVSDVRRARPAGRLFHSNGRLLRPAQNCSARYGGSIVLNAIENLSTHSYSETRIEEIGPDWLPDAVSTHSLSVTDRLVLTDGLRYRLKLRRGGN